MAARILQIKKTHNRYFAIEDEDGNFIKYTRLENPSKLRHWRLTQEEIEKDFQDKKDKLRSDRKALLDQGAKMIQTGIMECTVSLTETGYWLIEDVGVQVSLSDTDLVALLKHVASGAFKIEGKTRFSGFWQFSHPSGWLEIYPIDPMNLK